MTEQVCRYPVEFAFPKEIASIEDEREAITRELQFRLRLENLRYTLGDDGNYSYAGSMEELKKHGWNAERYDLNDSVIRNSLAKPVVEHYLKNRFTNLRGKSEVTPAAVKATIGPVDKTITLSLIADVKLETICD